MSYFFQETSSLLGGFTKCSPKNAREHFDESCQKSHKCSRAFSYLEKKVINDREQISNLLIYALCLKFFILEIINVNVKIVIKL